MSAGVVYVLTGERGAGKSTLCRRLVAVAVDEGLAVAGLLTERLGDEPDSPRRVTDLASGESRLFGSQRIDVAPVSRDPLTPGWQYDEGMFEWANQALSQTVDCDLLVIDEVGPLELKGGRGWVQALGTLRSGGFRAALVVCRPALLGDLSQSLAPRPTRVIEVDTRTRDHLATALFRELFPSPVGDDAG